MRRSTIDSDDLAGVAPLASFDEPFHVKYRPRDLADVIGQDESVAALRTNLRSKTRAHAYLFTGPSGCGKTTLSRIVAQSLDCGSVLEIDAASNSGIDAMRDVVAQSQYQSFGESPNRAIIIDEAHALSKQAWQSLLKPFEEPPAHVFYFLCTTETGKVPETIVTRCQTYNLKSVRRADLMDLLERVCRKENLAIADVVLEEVVRACDGSPRKALVQLAMVQGVRDRKEAASILAQPLEDAEVIDLCRAVIDKSLTWERLMEVLRAMPDTTTAESVRIVIANYLAKCLLGSKSSREAVRLLNVAHPFSKPFASTDKMLPLFMAFGDLIFGGD